jgi:hypothetical protein
MPTHDTDIPGVWRDEERLPLADLMQAVATSADDGQTDDLAGNDAGIEQARSEPDADTPEHGDPDPDSAAGRALRTDFTGPIGPH